MNTHSQRFVALILSSLMLVVAAPGRAAVVSANFTSASLVPVSAASYTATGNTLSLSLNFAPPVGTNLTVVKNTGMAFIQGTFDNLAQGQRVNLSYGGISYAFVANYFGGSGNDLVLQWANSWLLSWGYNGMGQLGNNSTTTNNVPVAVEMGGVLAGKTVLTPVQGGSHALALCSDGTLAAWGYNSVGQLGNNSTSNSSVPVWVDQTGVLAGKTVVALAGGGYHSLALCADGTLAAWGANSYGQLGNNSTSGSLVPVLVDRGGVLAGKSVVAIAADSFHNVALCSDGSVAAWGENGIGQLGNNSSTNSSVPVLVDRSGVLAGRTVTASAAGIYHDLVLCSDGNIAAWGDNMYGELGNNSTTRSSVPVLVDRSGVLSGKTVVAVSARSMHSVALCADGTLASWGVATDGELGNGTSGSGSSSSVPVLVSSTGQRVGDRVSALAMGSGMFSVASVAGLVPPQATTLAATAVSDTGATLNGSVSAQGNTSAVKFEYGLTTAYGASLAATPASVSGATLTAVRATLPDLLAGTTYHYRVVATSATYAVKGADMTLTTSTAALLAGLTVAPGPLAPDFNPLLSRYEVVLPNSVSQITLTPVCADAAASVTVNGTAAGSGVSVALAEGPNPVAVVVRAADGISTHTYAVKVTRLPAVLTFASAATVPVTVGSLVASGKSVTFGLSYAPAVGVDLTAVNNTGDGPIQGAFDNLAQGQTVNLSYGGISYRFVANYAGGNGNDLVLQWANTRLLAWGSNNYGQLGIGGTTSSSVPAAVATSGVLASQTVVATASGDSHNLAVCADGSLAAWGLNTYGQLGNNSNTNSSVPVAVTSSGVLAGKTIRAIAAGANHCLALCADGSLASWGYNSSGQLGNNGTASHSTAVLVDMSGVLAGKWVTAIAAGGDSSYALCSDGTLAAWGLNANGQLGNASTADSRVPVLVERGGLLAGKTVAAISAGVAQGYCLCTDGSLAAWGVNNYGQLGNNRTTSSSVPAAVDQTGVLAGKTVTAISAGLSHVLALCSDGNLAAWGYNIYGQLGNDGVTNSLVPVAVDRSGVLAGRTLSRVVAGKYHSLALCGDGTMAAWGNDTAGELGDGGSTLSNAPVQVTASALGTGERVVALGASGTSLALLASPMPPQAATLAATAVTDLGATLNGSANGQGASTSVSFEYGLTNQYGTSIAATPATLAGSMTTAVAANLSGLIPGATYHYRIVAASGGGTLRGGDLTFTTTTLASLTDLPLSSGTLLPAFASITHGYVAAVSNATSSLLVTPVCAYPSASVKVNGVAVASGTASAPLNLAVGNNTISIVVSAAGGGNTQTYTLTVARLPATFSFSSAAVVPVTVNDFVATGNTAEFALSYAPVPGTNLTVISNTGRNPINGRFANLAQGQTVAITYNKATYRFVANYYGGSGNDLVLQWLNLRAYAWGNNANGQLGNGTLSSGNVAGGVTTTGVLAGKVLTALAAGESHSLALCADGTLAAWGYNNYGQLGVATTITSSSVPVAVIPSGALAGKTVVAIAAGTSHNLALCGDGTLVAWGNNGSGQLGNAGTTTSSVPVAVNSSGALAGKTIVAIAAGGSHSLALCADGSLTAWGDGGAALGTIPVWVSSGVLAGKIVTAIAAGNSHSLALCADGTLAAWGSNGNSQLGNGTTVSSSVPVAVIASGVLAGKSVTSIAAGALHNLVRCSDGTLAAWGDNGYGQLGDGSTTNRSTPVSVVSSGALAGKTVTGVDAGYEYSLAICSDNSLAAWGYNYSGQLGSGTTINSTVPVAVSSAALAAGERFTSLAAGAAASHTLALAAFPISSNSNLASLTLSPGILEAPLVTGITSYTARVAHGTAALTVTATLADANATLTVNGAALASGTTSAPIPLAPGNKTLTLVVTAQDGSAQTYVVTVRDDATLSGLALSAGTLSPAFATDITSYDNYVPTATTAVTVTPSAADASAAISVNGAPVVSGGTSDPLSLAMGANTLNVVVSAVDGTTLTYRISVIRQVPLNFSFSSASAVAVSAAKYTAAGNTANLTLNFAPVAGTRLTVVNNTGAAPIQGVFDNLAQGQAVNLTYAGVT